MCYIILVRKNNNINNRKVNEQMFEKRVDKIMK